MLKPTSSPLRRAALAIAVLGSLAAPAGAAQAARSEATYSVTFSAEMTDKWQTSEHYTDDCKLTGAMCVRDEKGQGGAKVAVKTRRPTKVLVMRGLRGKPPTISMGATPGIPVTITSNRTGSLTTDYSGPWDAANPDQKADDSGCGRRTKNGHLSFMWHGRDRLGVLAPTLLELEADRCPDGPGKPWPWANDESPSLSEIVGSIDQTKFLRTRQFTVRGAKTFSAVIPTINRTTKLGTFAEDGSRTVTWAWEATFRMDGGRKKKRR